jgi:antitoxin component HigA of HigAB toxin-antitoxin module
MKKTNKTIRFADFPKEYRPLCELYLPRPIHDKVGYENALEFAETMAGFESQFTRDQSDYFELLTDLILAYEEEHEKSALGRFLGLDATMGNKILRGERKLTVDHVRKLSAHFSLQAEYFL